MVDNVDKLSNKKLRELAKEAAKGGQGDNSPEHVLKLLGRIGTEMNSSFFDVNSRKTMRGMLEKLPELLDTMDKRDEDFQMLPENRIPELKEEIKRNDEILRKNHESKNHQIQTGLYQKGLPPGSPMFDSLLERMKDDLEDAKLKLDSGLKTVNPVFVFQTNPRWVELQKKLHNRNIKALKENMQEIENNVKEVEADIANQNQKIKLRRIQIIDELKKLKVDVRDFEDKVPDYIQ